MPTKTQSAKEYSYYTYGFIYSRAVRLQNTLPWSPTSHLKTLYICDAKPMAKPFELCVLTVLEATL
jgi:hypothetical protein